MSVHIGRPVCVEKHRQRTTPEAVGAISRWSSLTGHESHRAIRGGANTTGSTYPPYVLIPEGLGIRGAGLGTSPPPLRGGVSRSLRYRWCSRRHVFRDDSGVS